MFFCSHSPSALSFRMHSTVALLSHYEKKKICFRFHVFVIYSSTFLPQQTQVYIVHVIKIRFIHYFCTRLIVTTFPKSFCLSVLLKCAIYLSLLGSSHLYNVFKVIISQFSIVWQNTYSCLLGLAQQALLHGSNPHHAVRKCTCCAPCLIIHRF